MKIRFWRRKGASPAAVVIHRGDHNQLVIEFGSSEWYPMDTRVIHVLGGRLTFWWYLSWA